MRKPALFILFLFFTITAYAQDTALHYIKFLHIGEKIQPVYTLNISYQDSVIPKDTDEMVIDSLHAKSIVTDQKTYKTLLKYIDKAKFRYINRTVKLNFGTFKVIANGKYFFLPGDNAAEYIKKLILYLKRRKSDRQVIDGLTDNYPWVF